MKQGGKVRGGRPWSFDRDAAIDTAMLLFWRHGYEGVSVGDLTKAIGVAPPSLYAAFGSKAGLYERAMARYEETRGGLDVAAIQSAASLPDAVRRLLTDAVAAVTQRPLERGCMISSGLVACHPDHADLARDAAARREALRARIVQALSPFAKDDPAETLARHLAAVMQGISIQARDGVAPSELHAIVDEVVAGIAARCPEG
ncbi:TetR/AcrR family transcriptional regulator [Methylobacterium nonmethylotrophicum]|uniref:TetR/AcrR family transcriptional regulator n=1 Tax=Methylobacterium nonmethylotrophicum TaxID=1141884 RepID=A0A4Z0NVE3_9HYPH|nr:TetR/AcrR family transcriptional regulator [Methylobacterium nonmethylotrophicum]TGE01117.1 TetR/AcrR family transcriptional regulator [Methylobacterium nonmethylotrophicum]